MLMTKLKLTTLGETSTGKTSIVFRLLKNYFVTTESTIGASFMTYNNENIRYEIWDTAGGERFMSLVSMYFRYSDIVVLVYDLDNLSSVDRLQYYFDKLNNITTHFDVIVIGNKLDLIDSMTLDNIKNTIPKKIIDMSNGIPIYGFVYTSAKYGEGFDNFKHMLFECGDRLKQKKNIDGPGTIILENESFGLPHSGSSDCFC